MDMNALPARQELHNLVDRLDEPQVVRLLRLVQGDPELAPTDQGEGERELPDYVGSFRSGRGDLAENADAYLAEGFGQ